MNDKVTQHAKKTGDVAIIKEKKRQSTEVNPEPHFRFDREKL